MAVSSSVTNPSTLSWHVNGGYASSATVEPKNAMQKIVLWLRNEQTPLLLKIAAVATPVIGTVAIGFLIGHPVIVIAALITVLIPVTIYAMYTWSKLNKAAEEAAAVAERAAQAFEAHRDMQETVGGEEAFNRLPVLDIGNQNGNTGYLDFLRPNDLTDSVMRGTDAAGRPFISLRLRSNAVARPDEDQIFVITFFQRYSTGGMWTYGTGANNHALARAFGNPIGQEERATIRQIVVDRNHPQLSLA